MTRSNDRRRAPVDAVVQIAGLRVRRGRTQVFDGLDLSVDGGAIVGLLGPSGCGKSTLIRAIVGTQVVAAGTVRVLGRPAGSAQLRGRIGYMPQSGGVYADLSVRGNLDYVARLLGVRPGGVEAVLSRVDLAGVAARRAGDLSGGQRSRVSLAMALLGEPELLVLDEPTVGLDPVLREELWRMFADLAAGGVSLLVSSHVMDEAHRCDQLVLLREGRVIAQDAPGDLLESTGTASMGEAFLALIGARR